MIAQQFSDEYLEQYLTHLKIDVNPQNKKLALWALNAPVPSGWEEGITKEGDLYYWKTNANGTRDVRWEHPIDNVLKEWIAGSSNRSEIKENDSEKIFKSHS